MLERFGWLLKDLFNQGAILCSAFISFLMGEDFFLLVQLLKSTIQLSNNPSTQRPYFPTWPRLVAQKGGSAHNSDHLVITRKAQRQLLVLLTILFGNMFFTTIQS